MLKIAQRIILGLGISSSVMSSNGMELNGLPLNFNSLAIKNFEMRIDLSEKKSNNICFEIKDSKIVCGSLKLKKELLENHINNFPEVLKTRANQGGVMVCPLIQAGSLQPGMLLSNNTMQITLREIYDNTTAFFTTPELDIKTTKINMAAYFGGRLSSKDVPSLQMQEFDFTRFFSSEDKSMEFFDECHKAAPEVTYGGTLNQWTLAVNPEYNNPPSKLESITFYKSSALTFPFSFYGEINFNFQQLNGNKILMIGADRVVFKFNPEAFK